MQNIARLQLGPNTKSKYLRIAVEVYVRRADSTPHSLCALYDSEAEINLICFLCAQALGYRSRLSEQKLLAKFLDNNALSIYDLYDLTIECTNLHSVYKLLDLQRFQAANFRGYNIVLGYLQLQEADPKIRFSTGQFEWQENNEDRLEITDAESLLGDISAGERAYVLYPNRLVCTTVSDKTRTAWQQALLQKDVVSLTDPAGPRGDVVQDTEWYHRYRLLQLKNLLIKITDYLKKCVEGVPALQQLSDETAR